jgi:IS5 family transposase
MTSGPLPDGITVHLDAGYDSQKTRDELVGRDLTGEIAHKGDKAPIQAGQRWHVERTKCLAQRLQPAPALLRTARGSHRRVLRHRRRDHHSP